jgi:hypothetical protein
MKKSTVRPAETTTDGEIILPPYSADDANTHFFSEDKEMQRRFPAPRIATLEATKAAVAQCITAHERGGRCLFALANPAQSLTSSP